MEEREEGIQGREKWCVVEYFGWSGHGMVVVVLVVMMII